MPQDLDFVLYFNIAFFSVLGLGMLFGFLRGLRKSIWSFFVNLIFYVVFFLTITQVVNLLWTINMPFLGGLLANVSPALSSATSLQEALPLLLEEFLPPELQSTLTNEHFLELVTSISLFAVKLVYTILYFTVIFIVYKLIFWILRMIIFPSRKKTDKYKSKNRGLGAVFGLLSGAMSLYITLIIFGGLISISQSLLNVLPNPNPQTLSYVELGNRFDRPTDSIIELADTANPFDDPLLGEAYNLLNDMVGAYNNNIVVQTQNQITMPSEYDGEQMAMNLYLFDSVLSMEYQEEQVAFRREIEIYSEVAGAIVNSDFIDTMDWADLTGDNIRDAFNALAESNLITSIIPIAVEVGADFVDTPIAIPTDELYEIDWELELTQLGTVAATAFDLINAAGILDGTGDYTTVTLDGDAVEEIFVALGQSQLVNLAAYVAIEPVLEMAGPEISSIITVPDDIVWADEFAAIGALANEILSTNITIGEITEADPLALLDKLSQIEFTVLLDSKIITNAMINILSGNTTIDVSFLSLPSNIADWDADDWNTELENILSAVSALAALSATIDITDFSNLTFDMIADLDLEAINAIFESRILVATVTDYLLNLDLGADFAIVIPDISFDEDGYLLKTELQAVVTAAGVMVDKLVCPVDEDCGDLGVNIAGILSLSGEDIDTVLGSNILWATMGTMILDLGGEVLTVPGTALAQLDVNEVSTDVVTKDEIKNAFLAISTLGISDFENIQVDTSILKNLAQPAPNDTLLDQDKADTLFASKILNATLSKFLFDFATPTVEQPDPFITIPYYDQLGNDVRIIDAIDSTQYISQDELTNILEAILALDIEDISNVEEFDISNLLSNVDTLLDSAILHATVSKMLLDMTDVIVVPYQTVEDVVPVQIKITVGTGVEETVYIAKAELQAAFDALEVLEITDINSISMDITILKNLAQEAPNDDLLDTAKSDVLFGSAIINATMSKFLLDFTNVDEGEEPLVIVPDVDQDGVAVILTEPTEGTEIISVAELTNILEAVLSLRLDSFDDFSTIDLDQIMSNVSKLLDSAILHATVSKQLLDLTDVIVVPYQTVEDVVPVPIKITQGDVTFISKTELQNTFDALEVLGITDINSVSMDITILKNLAQEVPNDDQLDTAKSDVLFGSAIINATMSKFLLDFTNVAEGEEPLVIVPDVDQDGNSVVLTEPVEGTEIIAVAELTNVLKAVLSLRLNDFSDFETIDLDVIMSNVSTLLDSAILHATVSKQLLDLTDVIVVPYQTVEDVVPVPIKITQGDVVFIDKTELQNTFDALEVLGITDINSVAMDITILKNLAQPEPNETLLDQGKADILFGSAIINATMSKFLLDFTNVAEGEDPLVIVPELDQDGVNIILTEPVEGIEIIAVSELTNVLEAVLALGINDFNEFETIGLSTIMTNVSTLLDSSILQATVSKQLLDLTDVIVVPYQTVEDVIPVPIKITQGTVTYIERTELENTFNALEVLGISDINSVSMDITILKNLAQEAPNDNLLDQTKADTLFSSVIIKATISKFLLDFTVVAEGEDPLVIVPDVDQDNNPVVLTEPNEGIDIVTQAELTNVLEAVLALGLDDFNQFETLGLDTIIANAATLIDSAILHATVSDQLLALTDVIVVPYQTVEDVVPVPIKITRGDVTFIEREELLDTFDALEVLGLTDINSVSMDITILKNLAQEAPNDNLLDTTKSDILFDSVIISATMSKFLLDFTNVAEGEDPLVIVPEFDQDNTAVILNEPNEDIDIISVVELTNVLEAVLALRLDDFNQFDTLGLDTIIANAPTLLDSSILHATISKQLLDLGDLITVPYQTIEDVVPVPIKITRGDITFIEKLELIDTFDALEVLGITDINSVSIDTSILQNLAQEAPNDNQLDTTKSDTLFESVIIKATISKFLLDFTAVTPEQPDPFVIVPHYDFDTVAVRMTEPVEGVEIIVQAELTNILKAIIALDLVDFNDFETITLTQINNNLSTLLDSAILHATISKQLIEMDDGSTIIIPYESELKYSNPLADQIRKTVNGVEFVLKDELEATFAALPVFGIDNFQDFSTTGEQFTIGNFNDNIDLLLASSMLHAVISKQILDQADGGTILVPYMKENDTDPVRIEVITDDLAHTNNYIEGNEIRAIINMLDVLGLDDVSQFTGSVSLAQLSEPGFKAALLASSIVQANISDQLIASEDGVTFIIPDEDELLTPVVIVTGPVGNQTTYVSNQEISDLLDALEVLGMDDVTDFDSSSVNFQTFSEGSNATIMAESVIIQAIISKQLIDVDNDPVIDFIIPYQASDNSDIRVTVTDGAGTIELVVEQEIVDVIYAMKLLGVTNPAEYGGGVSLGVFFKSTYPLAPETATTNQNTLLASAIMHATVSSQITNMGGIVVPASYMDTTTIHITTDVSADEFIIGDEIKALFDALDAIGFNAASNLSTFDGSISLSGIANDDAKQTTMLASAIMHATISDKLTGLSDNLLLVPEFSAGNDGNETYRIYKVVLTYDFIDKQEIKYIIDGFDLLGLGGFEMTTAIDAQDFFTYQDELLLSSSIHATLSNRLFEINTNPADPIIIYPEFDIREAPDKDIMLLHNDGITFIEMTELLLFMDALDEMGLTNFGDITGISPTQIVGTKAAPKDLSVITASAIMQATASDKILDGATDYANATNGGLIISNYHREDITVGVATEEWIEQSELILFLAAVRTAGITDFGATIGGNTFNTLTELEISDIMDSASMYLTIENMIKSNNDLNSYIPTVAVEAGALYDLNGLIENSEVEEFILAIKALDGDLSGDVNIAALQGVNETQRNTALQSDIVRCRVTPDLVTIMILKLDPYDGTDYESYGPDLVLYTSALEAFN